MSPLVEGLLAVRGHGLPHVVDDVIPVQLGQRVGEVEDGDAVALAPPLDQLDRRPRPVLPRDQHLGSLRSKRGIRDAGLGESGCKFTFSCLL